MSACLLGVGLDPPLGVGWQGAAKGLLFAKLLFQPKQMMTTPNSQRVEQMSVGGGSL